jgi:hypothetical protein
LHTRPDRNYTSNFQIKVIENEEYPKTVHGASVVHQHHDNRVRLMTINIVFPVQTNHLRCGLLQPIPDGFTIGDAVDLTKLPGKYRCSLVRTANRTMMI